MGLLLGLIVFTYAANGGHPAWAGPLVFLGFHLFFSFLRTSSEGAHWQAVNSMLQEFERKQTREQRVASLYPDGMACRLRGKVTERNEHD